MVATPLASSFPTAPAAPCSPVALSYYLAHVPDPRDPRGVRHPLPALLGLVCCALLCGQRHLQAIADWGRDHSPALMTALGFTRPKTPCVATLHYVLADLEWEALEVQLRRWARAVGLTWDAREPEAAEEALALDGKSVRGALKQGSKVAQLVSALGHCLGLTHGAAVVVDGDEIAAVEAVLQQVVLAGKVVTLDALHTQRRTARLIGERGGQYVMTVKGNQPDLHAAVVGLFAPGRRHEQDRECATVTECGHGRSEERRLVRVALAEGELDWPGAAQAFVVSRSVWYRKQQRHHHEVVYGVTSLRRAQAGAADLLRLVRGHWRIENRSHWVRDVVWGEDAGLTRTGQLPAVLALLRTAALSALRAAGVTSIARETRRLAAQPADSLRFLGLDSDN